MTDAAADRNARERALDARRSFIVQAPAGSGKTELLIQRYLTLLATVEQPEQIVAITFTRKAAAEMRGRILAALKQAAAGDTIGEAHRATTRRLAEAALERDARLEWSLLAQPHRLRIDTLDALNAWLAQRLPLLAGGVAGARIVEDAAELYRRAARRTLEQLAERSAAGAALRALLPLVDNSLARMETLLADLLPRRDQWLRHLAGVAPEALRQRLESGLVRLVAHEVAELEARFPPGLAEAVAPLLRHAAAHARNGATAEALDIWRRLDSMPAEPAEALAAWRAVAALLLTRQGTWRRQVTRNEGFGPEHPEETRRLKALLESLEGGDALAESLASVRALPEPRYDDAQWQDLVALRALLMHLLAELKVVLTETQSVDFVELALAAQQALGRTDRPSDLLLALDRRVQHLLVDEFQDTSHAQIRLLELLTSGWEPGDGRSLFLVGDPMQSIYRFRDADMSLFLKVKQRGIGGIRCDYLALECNFRSAPGIVDWVNETFGGVFPAEDRIEQGVARFHPCRAARGGASSRSAVEMHAVIGGPETAEIVEVIDILEREQRADPKRSIAILVQSRGHLLGLHEHLLAAGWPVHAVEIDAVADQQIGQDLVGLTRALCHHADRIAWLGVLRAPWCGLTWDDLHRLCADGADRSVWSLLNDPARVAALSRDGQRRATAVRAVLHEAQRRRGMLTLSRWVERTWLALDGPAAVERGEDLDVAGRFFAHLDELGRDGDLPDPAVLEHAFVRAAGRGEAPQGAGIEIMTIHRAKGLEFDTVVLFGLGREPRGDDARALYWIERLDADGSDDLLMAPLPRGDDRLTAYLRRADRQREAAERARVLYVATTRARERLHLVARLGADEERPRPGTLLEILWARVAAAFETGAQGEAGALPEPCSEQPRLRRFADGFHAAAPELETAPGPSARPMLLPEFEWAGRTAVHVGTLVHRYLHEMSETGLAVWDRARLHARAARIRGELALLGVEPADLRAAAERVTEALDEVLRDPVGRWALAARPDAESELRLTVRTESGLEHLQLDRSFVEDGTRWIVDYKTSRHEGGDLDAFLDSEVGRYRAQLERYAAAMAEIDPRPTRVGLYFPMLRAFRDWAPSVDALRGCRKDRGAACPAHPARPS